MAGCQKKLSPCIHYISPCYDNIIIKTAKFVGKITFCQNAQYLDLLLEWWLSTALWMHKIIEFQQQI